jgi:hypothetical protein
MRLADLMPNDLSSTNALFDNLATTNASNPSAASNPMPTTEEPDTSFASYMSTHDSLETQQPQKLARQKMHEEPASIAMEEDLKSDDMSDILLPQDSEFSKEVNNLLSLAHNTLDTMSNEDTSEAIFKLEDINIEEQDESLDLLGIEQNILPPLPLTPLDNTPKTIDFAVGSKLDEQMLEPNALSFATAATFDTLNPADLPNYAPKTVIVGQENAQQINFTIDSPDSSPSPILAEVIPLENNGDNLFAAQMTDAPETILAQSPFHQTISDSPLLTVSSDSQLLTNSELDNESDNESMASFNMLNLNDENAMELELSTLAVELLEANELEPNLINNSDSDFVSESPNESLANDLISDNSSPAFSSVNSFASVPSSGHSLAMPNMQMPINMQIGEINNLSNTPNISIQGEFTTNTVVGSAEWTQEISEVISKQMYSTNMRYASIKLNPSELGPINLELVMDANTQQATINFEVANLETRRLLERDASFVSQKIIHDTNLVNVSLNFGSFANQDKYLNTTADHNSNSDSNGSRLAYQLENGEPETINRSAHSASRHSGIIDIKV